MQLGNMEAVLGVDINELCLSLCSFFLTAMKCMSQCKLETDSHSLYRLYDILDPDFLFNMIITRDCFNGVFELREKHSHMLVLLFRLHIV